MKVTTIAVQHIEADIVHNASGLVRISNGSPIKTANFVDRIVAAVRDMEEVFETLDGFTVELYFTTAGVTVRGEKG